MPLSWRRATGQQARDSWGLEKIFVIVSTPVRKEVLEEMMFVNFSHLMHVLVACFLRNAHRDGNGLFCCALQLLVTSSHLLLRWRQEQKDQPIRFLTRHEK